MDQTLGTSPPSQASVSSGDSIISGDETPDKMQAFSGMVVFQVAAGRHQAVAIAGRATVSIFYEKKFQTLKVEDTDMTVYDLMVRKMFQTAGKYDYRL
jgi:hypothetical protein